MESESTLIKLIKRTSEYHKAVSRIFNDLNILEDPRCMVSFPSVYLSVEYAIGAHALLALGMKASGYILYRPQFESLVRGMWFLYSANDSFHEKILEQMMAMDRDIQPKDRVNLPTMLMQLEKSKAPKHIIDQLIEFRDVTLKTLNSFVHGGNYPILMTVIDYPPDLPINAMLNSNALVAIASQLAVNLSDDKTKIERVYDLHKNFRDCIPISN